MGTGWRRAFCTSIRRDPETAASPVELQPGASPSPRNCTRLSFFGKSSSTPSTPRLMQQQQKPPSQPSTPTLRCRTKSAAAGPVSGDVIDSPNLQCKTSVAGTPKSEAAAPGSCGRSPRFPFVSSNPPPSPRSPSRFALLRNNLRLSRSNCGICLQSVKAKQGTAIFTAECSHVFHFHCIAASVRKQGSLVCPVCRAAWRQVPLLSDVSAHRHHGEVEDVEQENQKRKLSAGSKQGKVTAAGDDELYNKVSRVYNDDEPLLHVTACGAGRFNPIPEAEEEQQEEDRDDDEFRGFFSLDPSPVSSQRCTAGRRHQLGGGLTSGGGVQVMVLPTVALLSAGRSHENYVVALKVKAPSPAMPRSSPTAAVADGSATAPPLLLDPSRRAPIDLVTVLDVGGNMTSAKLHMMKRAMRLVVASLGPADRLSIVAFSTSAKRLLPLRRMSPEGQRAARRIVDRLLYGEGSCASEALRKAVKVLEDRRERNPVASIMLLSDAQQQQQGDHPHVASPRCGSGLRGPTSHSDVPFSPNTRFAHLEIPVQASGIGAGPRQEDAEDVFARCVGGLLSVVLQGAHLEFTFASGEVCSIYACGGRHLALGSGAGPVRLGDMYADEERELLVELRVPYPRRGAGAEQDHHLLPLSVRCTYRDPSTQELVHGREQRLLVPITRHHAPAHGVDRLRNLFVTTRSVAEARRLADHGDFPTGLHLLSSARRLLLQSSSVSVEEDLRAVEAELEQIHCRRQQMRRSDAPETPTFSSALDDGAGADALTPTSAWRAAERLAKVAIMRKSLNRVSDLHGFENARF